MKQKRNQKNRQSTDHKGVTKKATVLGTEKKSPLPLLAMLGCVGLAILIGLFLLGRVGRGSSPVVSSNQVSHPVGLFEDGQARHFQYRTEDGLTIKYFVLKSSDGVLRAAFDACDVCWSAGKGYDQQGDFMVCQNCGRRFASIRVNEVRGGCNPAPLSRKVVDGRLVIEIEDILEGRQYFDFSRRS